MNNDSIFAILTVRDNKNIASSAFRLEANARWFKQGAAGIAERPIINSRETTPAEDPSLEDDRLVVTFDKLSEKLESGVQLGTDPSSSHILLGHRGTRGISAKQCNIVVGDDLHIWLHDYYSTHGTIVIHDDQNQNERRRKETWLLAYPPGMRNPFTDVQIRIGGLVFKIDFPNHKIPASPDYVKNLQAFVQRCKRAEETPAIDRLGFESGLTTQAPSEAPTVKNRFIYYRTEVIAKGEYGEVHKVIRARDGKIFAAKSSLSSIKGSSSKREIDEDTPKWLRKIRNEFTIMKENPHANIMQVFEFREEPQHMIVMDYYPDGNILDAKIVDEGKQVTTWGQVLDGLSHLHAKGVVHRDLKPANIMVAKEPFFKIAITDFGFSKVETNENPLKTFCGTTLYLAPEIYPGFSNGHGTLVDIWSLGILVLEWIYHLPEVTRPPGPKEVRQHQDWGKQVKSWVMSLYQKLDDQEEGDIAVEILKHMIEYDVQVRWSASECLALGFKNGMFLRRKADGLVACTEDQEDFTLLREDKHSETNKPSRPNNSKASSTKESLLPS